jgi:hypothetical protein
MKDYAQLATRAAHAEREACRLIGAALDTLPSIRVPARAALALLPPDLSDIGGRPQLVLEVLRRHPDKETPEAIMEFAVRVGVDIAGIGLGGFLVECVDSPAFQPEQAVQSICNFTRYCSQLRAVEVMETKAWQGRNLELV